MHVLYHLVPPASVDVMSRGMSHAPRIFQLSPGDDIAVEAPLISIYEAAQATPLPLVCARTDCGDAARSTQCEHSIQVHGGSEAARLGAPTSARLGDPSLGVDAARALGGCNDVVVPAIDDVSVVSVVVPAVVDVSKVLVSVVSVAPSNPPSSPL